MRKAPAALAILFLFAHLVWSPVTFGDIDEVNFALGVRHFDVAAHQPHPPGYPVFIGAARISTAVLRAAGVPAAEVRGITWLNGLAGAVAIPLLVALFRSLTGDRRVALWSAAAVAVAPVFWFTASRPLSDVSGFVAALSAQVLLVSVLVRRDGPARGAAAILGAFVAGIAVGVRSQSFLLTLPLLAVALVAPGTGLTLRHRFSALLALASGGLAWAVPLVWLSGGIDGYLAALGDQAGEDFTGALMFWTSRSPRVLADALQYSFLWPWGGLVAGVAVVGLATMGGVRMLLRQRPALLILLLAYVPYAVFHLVFQETVMTRYALPLLPPLALLAVQGLAAGGRAAVHAGGVAFVAAAFLANVPASRAYAAEASPAARIISDALDAGGATGRVGMHAVMLRLEQWYHGHAPERVIRAPHGGEILALVDRWRESPDLPVHFMADPRRSDLAMLDPRSVEFVRSYGWSFPEMPFVSGARPNSLQLFVLRPPGWMLDQGWAVTAEVAGQSERAGARPEVRPSVVWVRSREEAALMIIGGRNLGQPGSVPARFVVRLGERVLGDWSIEPGFFLQRLALPAGTLAAADAYAPLSVTASAPREGEVGSLEQFDLQADGVPMLGFASGWQEPEYNRVTAAAWRWMSARAELWIRPIGRDVTVTFRAESPLRYFAAPPALRASVGGEAIAQLSPSDEFTWTMTLPDRLLATHGGTVVIESDKWFVPGGSAGGDQRQLALRVYSVTVE